MNHSGECPDITEVPTWYVYILKCASGTYYTGHTQDVQARVERHRKGQGATLTKHDIPTSIMFTEQFNSETEAMRRELQLKRWSRAKKEALIHGNLKQLHTLSKSRS